MRMDFLPLPKPYDKAQMWRAVALMNHGSHTLTAQSMSVLRDAWLRVREASMSDLEYPRFVEQKVPDHARRMHPAEQAISIIVSEQV